MPIPKETLDRIEESGSETNLSPNGRNAVSCVRTIKRLSEKMHEIGTTDYNDLYPEDQTEWEEAWEDFQFWSQLLSNEYVQNIVDNDDCVEVEFEVDTDEEDNPIYEKERFMNPHSITTSTDRSENLPDMPDL